MSLTELQKKRDKLKAFYVIAFIGSVEELKRLYSTESKAIKAVVTLAKKGYRVEMRKNDI